MTPWRIFLDVINWLHVIRLFLFLFWKMLQVKIVSCVLYMFVSLFNWLWCMKQMLESCSVTVWGTCHPTTVAVFIAKRKSIQKMYPFQFFVSIFKHLTFDSIHNIMKHEDEMMWLYMVDDDVIWKNSLEKRLHAYIFTQPDLLMIYLKP